MHDYTICCALKKHTRLHCYVIFSLMFQVRSDDYGEYINMDDFDISSMKEDNKENMDLQIAYEDDDLMGE